MLFMLKPDQKIEVEVKAGNKVLKQYAQPQLNDKCYVYLVRLYFSKYPKLAFQKDLFYWCPNENISISPGIPWFEERI